MDLGLLWLDADPRRDVVAKVEDAARRYRQRFGRPPECCLVNPADACQHPSLRVVPDPRVPRYHFLVGRDEPSSRRRPA
ncbi:MAG TPA: hypothetical protein VIN09_12950 [Chloroflexota bacterium]